MEIERSAPGCYGSASMGSSVVRLGSTVARALRQATRASEVRVHGRGPCGSLVVGIESTRVHIECKLG